MKKKMSRIVAMEIHRVAWNFIVLLFLSILIIFGTLDAGWSSTRSENDEISMEFHADYFIVSGKDTGVLHISFSGTDINKVEITEDDIAFKGFSAAVTYFNVSEYGDHVYCLMALSNITNTSGKEEKLIELKEGVAAIHGEDSPPLNLKIWNNIFISMQQFMILSILLSIACNILFLVYASILYGGDMIASILLWIDFIICGSYPFVWYIKIVNLNLNNWYTFFAVAFVVVDLSFCIWVSKRTLKSSGYYLFMILLSTLTIAYFSKIFSRYYLHIGQVYGLPSIDNLIIDPMNSNYANHLQYELSDTLYYIELSFRYFFIFPPDEYYGWIAILQFLVGKVYEVVVFGSVGSIILEHVRQKNTKDEKADVVRKYI